MKNKVVSKILKIIVFVFAIIGILLTGTYLAIRFGWTNNDGIIDQQQEIFLKDVQAENKLTDDWKTSKEWTTLKEAVIRDKEIINKASNTANIEPRLLVSILIVEQLRLYYSDRDLFETAFAPLKVLGSQNVMSLGVMGIKPDTAIAIEHYLKDPHSEFYPGKQFEHTLDYNDEEISETRFKRLTNPADRYYSYLYASLFVQQLQTQWENAHHSIEHKPGITATLYNLGFEKSHPKPEPKIGGAEIEIGSEISSFGGLAEAFYQSEELIKDFPRAN